MFHNMQQVVNVYRGEQEEYQNAKKQPVSSYATEYAYLHIPAFIVCPVIMSVNPANFQITDVIYRMY